MPTGDQKQKTHKELQPDFHGAAVIDAQGKEQPITETMVADALQELDKPATKRNVPGSTPATD